MDAMLRELSTDPRVNLKAGFRDAGEAALNLERVATLPKPDGFYDPSTPAGRPMTPEKKPEKRKERNEPKAAEKTGQDADKEDEKEDEDKSRPGLLSFANTDLAFSKEVVIEGNYHGFNTYNIEDPMTPQLLASVVCPGGQGDVSLYGNLLFMSVEQTRGRIDCGVQGVAEPKSGARFRGIRIFDISDMRMPKQVAAVQTCRGSHTHTLVNDPDDKGNIYVYNSGTSSVRPKEELAECSDANPAADAEYGALQHRRDPGPPGPTAGRAHREPPAHFRRFEDRSRRGPMERRATTDPAHRRPPRPTCAMTSPSTPSSGSRRGPAPATASSSTSPTRRTPCGSTR